ncbi:ANTAR domain-containing protein [Streptomyces sp. AC555_RSS877]|uniref:ANTAR domain-containing protein n=1 Tax=Streptomyces sp. AC555_RSS877 TaxID=2823688 RepID=UPI0027E57ACE|nr:ANTAR domain-containing protein [Streptomyces sp. AC555_RSS877]
MENEQLKQAMESRPVIDMARGVLMGWLVCPSENAWEILVEVSQRSNVKVRVVVGAVTAAAAGKEPMPQTLRDHLVAAVARWQVDGNESTVSG